MGSKEADVVVECLTDECCDKRSDAQNVVRAAYAEEREARALEREVRGQEILQFPGLRDLLQWTEGMIALTQTILDQRPAEWPARAFVAGVQDTLQALSTNIRAEIQRTHLLQQTGAAAAAPEQARKARGRS